MTSITMTRPCDSAVECRRSSASVANATAVSKPKVTTVLSRSLSIVFGTPTIRSPFAASAVAMPIEPSPPIAMCASMLWRLKARINSSVRSTSPIVPSGRRTG